MGLVVTKTAVTITVDFGTPGSYNDKANVWGKRIFARRKIEDVFINKEQESVTVVIGGSKNSKDWYLQAPGYTGKAAMIVDSIDSTAVTNNDLNDLRDKIAALII